jgi:capsular exopolysaccharide synthesis family protein
MADQVFEAEARRRETSLRDLCYIFFRHKWKMILFFLAIVLCVAVLTFCCDEIYRSEAKLMVRLGRESVALDPTATTGQIIPITQSRENEVQAELEILKSREIAEQVVAAIGPEAFLKRAAKEPPAKEATGQRIQAVKQRIGDTAKKLRDRLEKWHVLKPVADRDKAVLIVMENVKIETQKGSSTISVSYEASNPQLAQQVLAKLTELYLERHIEVHTTPGSYQFFTKQSEQLRAKLVESENQLRDLRNRTGISSLEDQQRVLLDRIGTLETDIDRAEAAAASSQAKVRSLQATLATMPETVVTASTSGIGNYGVDLMRDRLYQLQLREQDLASKYTDESRQLQEVRRQIAEAQAMLSKEEPSRTQVTQGLNVAHQQVKLALLTEEATLAFHQAEVEAIRRRLGSTQAELTTLNDNATKVKALMREIDIEETNYRKYSSSLEQARIDQALQTGRISNISVVQPATLPIKPVRPRTLLQLLLGILLGTFGGIGLAFLAAYLDHSIKTPEEAEQRLQLPALASIPRVHADTVRSAGWWGEKAKQWIIPAGVREQYYAFRERLLLHANGSKETTHIFAVTGSRSGEGVSTVAANLATALARLEDGHVLLVDTDLGHPSLHRIFKRKLAPGLADVLKNGQPTEDAILPSPVQNLDILSAGATNGDPAEIFDSQRFPRLLNATKANYRFVVIDLPAVNEASWAVRLANLCDGVTLVVEAERSRREVAQRAKEQLIESKANILGVVINKRRFRIPGWLYRRL